MLLTSADTKSSSKHEEISTANNNNNTNTNNGSSNDNGNFNNNTKNESSLSPAPNDDDDDRTRSSMADDDLTTADSMDSPLISEERSTTTDRQTTMDNGEATTELMVSSMENSQSSNVVEVSSESVTATANATIAASAVVSTETRQMTQLSVPAEENSAFKNYIDETAAAIQMDNGDDDDELAADKKQQSQSSSNDAATHEKPLICNDDDDDGDDKTMNYGDNDKPIELRLLVRRREAGALIGKKGANIKRLRETFRLAMISIPDTGNGPERVVCITSDPKSIDPILTDITRLLVEKSPENDEQVELKLLIHSSHAGSIIGIGGQSIKKLRNESKAAIKIYEMCCPLSNERVCAIKARPLVVVSTIKLIQSILKDNPTKGTIKPYDALHFDLSLVDKYGGYFPEEPMVDLFVHNHNHNHNHNNNNSGYTAYEPACHSQQKHYDNPNWRREYYEPCDIHAQEINQHNKILGESTAVSFHRIMSSPGGNLSKQQHQHQQQAAKLEQEQNRKQFHSNHRQHLNPINRSVSRFHPYASQLANSSGSGNNSCHQSHRSNHHNHNHPRQQPSALHQCPSPFPTTAAALIAAAAAAASAVTGGSGQVSPVQNHRGGYGPQSLGPLHHVNHNNQARTNQLAPSDQARMVANQFLYPNNSGPSASSAGGACSHLSPCLCMFLPHMMHESLNHHHLHHHPPHHHSHQSAMLAAYAQVATLDAGDECNNSFHQPSETTTTTNEQQQQQQHQQRLETPNSPNNSNGKNK